MGAQGFGDHRKRPGKPGTGKHQRAHNRPGKHQQARTAQHKAEQGTACYQRGDLRGAIDGYRQALAIKPDYPDVLFNLGIALGDQGDLDGAIASYRKSLAIEPNSHVLSNLGLALKEQGDLQAAIDCYRKAVVLNPGSPEIVSNLGAALTDQGDVDGAIDCCRRAIAINPDFAYAHSNLGFALSEQGDHQRAIASYERALALDNNYADARWNLSHSLLCIGDYENGWENYEWRFRRKENYLNAHPPIEAWNGSNLGPGENLVMVSEQALGDTIQFMRYIGFLNSIGVPAALCAQTKLHGLIRSSGVTTVVYSPEEGNQLAAGKWLPLMSLPRYLKVSPDHPIVTAPYIKIPEPLITKWKQKLAPDQRPIIGINWHGNPQPRKGMAKDGRSIPLEAFAPIAERTDASLLSLQKGMGSDQLDGCAFSHRFVGCQAEISQIWDFVETGAMIANCDLVITSDTAVAHLAAGSGATTWLLLRKVAEWRWGPEGDTSFWYPSMRLFRQREWGNWSEVMERVVAALLMRSREETSGGVSGR